MMTVTKTDSSGEDINSSSSQQKVKHGPVQLACISCRTRHLKCDARVPVCGRCQTEAHECHYVRSRRGYKGPRKAKAGQNDVGDRVKKSAEKPNVVSVNRDTDFNGRPSSQLKPRLSPKSCPLLRPNAFSHLLSLPDAAERQSVVSSNTPSSDNSSTLTYHTQESLRGSFGSLLSRPGPEASQAGEYLRDLYYQHFHASHPILLPRRKTARNVLDRPACAELTTMIIGSHFAPEDLSAFRSSAIDYLLAHELGRVGGTVQVYLLIFIVLHAQNEQARARSVLDRAIDLALDLGMNRKSFAYDNGEGNPHMEEMFRRTWWELYIIEAMLAALQQASTFRLRDVETDVGLPCEERIYQNEDYLPVPRTLAQFRDRAFSNSGVEFSSYAYRIDAARCLASVLALGQDYDSDDQDRVEAVDASLSSWFLHLPQSKREILDGCSENAFDEILFQAHMIIYSAQIYLHRPRSSLNLALNSSSPHHHLPIDTSTFCGRDQKPSQPITTPRTHAIKALRAANALSSLAALTVPVTRHSPFFICVTVLAAIVQVSAASVSFDAKGARRSNLLPRIRLAVGVLGEIGSVWEIARDVVGQVRAVARGLGNLDALEYASPTSSRSCEPFDLSTIEEVMQPQFDTSSSNGSAPIGGVNGSVFDPSATTTGIMDTGRLGFESAAVGPDGDLELGVRDGSGRVDMCADMDVDAMFEDLGEDMWIKFGSIGGTDEGDMLEMGGLVDNRQDGGYGVNGNVNGNINGNGGMNGVMGTGYDWGEPLVV